MSRWLGRVQQHLQSEPAASAAGETAAERAQTDEALRMAGPVAVPSDLQLRLRLALSHERVRAQRRWTGQAAHRLQIWYENRLRPIGIQLAVATAAVVVFAGGAAMLGAVSPGQAVEANDAPLAGFSAPHYLYAVADNTPLHGIGDQPLIVQAQVNARGQVYGYRLLSGELDAATATELRQHMLSSVFEPARVFGEPVRGSVVLTFAEVVVRG